MGEILEYNYKDLVIVTRHDYSLVDELCMVVGKSLTRSSRYIIMVLNDNWDLGHSGTSYGHVLWCRFDLGKKGLFVNLEDMSLYHPRPCLGKNYDLIQLRIKYGIEL